MFDMFEADAASHRVISRSIQFQVCISKIDGVVAINQINKISFREELLSALHVVWDLYMFDRFEAAAAGDKMCA